MTGHRSFVQGLSPHVQGLRKGFSKAKTPENCALARVARVLRRSAARTCARYARTHVRAGYLQPLQLLQPLHSLEENGGYPPFLFSPLCKGRARVRLNVQGLGPGGGQKSERPAGRIPALDPRGDFFLSAVRSRSLHRWPCPVTRLSGSRSGLARRSANRPACAPGEACSAILAGLIARASPPGKARNCAPIIFLSSRRLICAR